MCICYLDNQLKCDCFTFLGIDAYLKIKPQILEGLKGVKDQASESEKYSDLDKGPATFGVVKKLRDNDMELHSNQQVMINTCHTYQLLPFSSFFLDLIIEKKAIVC